MSLSNALFTGLSGLDVNQTKLSVIGNNIANANSVAFKASRVLLKPQFYITDAAGTPPTQGLGGTNPSQRGLGALIGAIEKDFSPGSLEPTGVGTDLAIDGNGFFIVQSPAGQFYTRDGSFKLNSANQLVTTTGAFVQGFGVDADFNVIPGQLQNITVPLGAMAMARQTERVKLKGNLNADGAVASGASILNSQTLTVLGGGAPPTDATLLTDLASALDNGVPLFSVDQVFTLAGKKGGRELPSAQFTVEAGSTLGELMDFFRQGLGINTTVPDDGDPNTPVPGVTLEQLTGDPNVAQIVVAGNLGYENRLELGSGSFLPEAGPGPFSFSSGVNAAGNTDNPVGESVQTSFIAYDSLGTPLTVSLTMVFERADDAGNVWRFYAESGDDTDVDLALGTGTLTFDNQGQLTLTEGADILLHRADTGAVTPLTVRLDFDGMTSLTSRFSEMVITEQDGSPIGSLNAFSISADGSIVGTYTNGMVRTLGQVALATFNNPLGLVDAGGNMYLPGASSGVAIITSPQQLGAGAIRVGSLELSNVDLSEQFVNMIITTTGFSAASRVITTSDRLVQELLNSSR